MCLMSCLTEVQPLVTVKSKFVVDPKSKSIFLLFHGKQKIRAKALNPSFLRYFLLYLSLSLICVLKYILFIYLMQCFLNNLSQCVCSVIQSCPTPCDPMDCRLPGSSVHGIYSGKNTGVCCHFLLQRIFLTQGSNLHLLHWQADSLPLSYLGNPVYVSR